jgi:hypothetical protein
MSAKTNNRWWEGYLTRYLIGTVVGALCIVYLMRGSGDGSGEPSGAIQRLLSHVFPCGVNFETSQQIFKLSALGFALCYIASAPVTLLHYLRNAGRQTKVGAAVSTFTGITIVFWTFLSLPLVVLSDVCCVLKFLFVVPSLVAFVVLWLVFFAKPVRRKKDSKWRIIITIITTTTTTATITTATIIIIIITSIIMAALMSCFMVLFHCAEVPNNKIILIWQILLGAALVVFGYFSAKGATSLTACRNSLILNKRLRLVDVDKGTFKELSEHGNAFSIIVLELIFTGILSRFSTLGETTVFIIAWVAPGAFCWLLAKTIEKWYVHELRKVDVFRRRWWHPWWVKASWGKDSWNEAAYYKKNQIIR